MKILIIGAVGSGKTTYAKYLSQKLNINYYEIDCIVHNDEHNIKRKYQEQLQIINNINKQNDWIIEGTLRKNLDILLELTDKIIWLNTPSKVRTKRIITRFIKQKLNLEKSSYKPTLSILLSILKWNREFNEKEFFEKLSKYPNKLEIINN